MIFYFISKDNMDGKIIHPRVPEHRIEYEDSTTKRICTSLSIYGCLTGISGHNIGDRLYVHMIESDDYVQPDWEQVGDVQLTGEMWVMEPVKLEKIMQIEITNVMKWNDGETGCDQYSFVSI